MCSFVLASMLKKDVSVIALKENTEMKWLFKSKLTHCWKAINENGETFKVMKILLVSVLSGVKTNTTGFNVNSRPFKNTETHAVLTRKKVPLPHNSQTQSRSGSEVCLINVLAAAPIRESLSHRQSGSLRHETPSACAGLQPGRACRECTEWRVLSLSVEEKRRGRAAANLLLARFLRHAQVRPPLQRAVHTCQLWLSDLIVRYSFLCLNSL